MLELNEPQKAYLAGLIDGEGSIFIARVTTKYNVVSRRIHHQLRVAIHNTDYAMVAWVKSVVGYGHIKRIKQKSERHKPAYAYVVCSLKALEILQAVYPYLITKRRHAEVAFVFGETVQDRLNNKYGYRGLPASIVDAREQCKVAINLLNGNNGGHKLRVWKNLGGEVGGTVTGHTVGNPEPSRN